MFKNGATSLNVGGGGTGAHMQSNLNESELEIEFGYCSEEESVF